MTKRLLTVFQHPRFSFLLGFLASCLFVTRFVLEPFQLRPNPPPAHGWRICLGALLAITILGLLTPHWDDAGKPSVRYRVRTALLLATVGVSALIFFLTLLGAGIPLETFGPLLIYHSHFYYGSLWFGLIYFLSLISLCHFLQRWHTVHENFVLAYVILFPFALILYCLDGYTKFGGDTTFNVLLPSHLLHGGRLPLTADFVRSVGWIGIVRVEGGYMPVWPLGASLFTAPFSLVQRLLGVPPSYDAASYAQRIAAAGTAALGSALLYSLLLRRSKNRWLSGWLGLGFALGSPQVLISAKMLWQHGPAVLCLLLGLRPLIVRETRGEESSFQAVSSGFFQGLLFAIRPQTVFFLGAGLLSWTSMFGRRAATQFLFGSAVPLLVLIGFNLYFFSHPAGGYGLVQNPHQFASYFFESLPGLWLSPNRGLFVFSPFLLWGVIGVFRCCRRLKSWEFWYAAAALSYALVHGLFVDWRAGWAIGPRYMTETAPLFTLFAAEALRRRGSTVLFPSTVALSILICLPGSFFSDAQTQWNIFPNSDSHRTRAWQVDDWLPLHFLRQAAYAKGEKTEAALLVTNENLSPPSTQGGGQGAVMISARPHWQRISDLPTAPLEAGDYQLTITGRLLKPSAVKLGVELELVDLSFVRESLPIEDEGTFEKTIRFSLPRSGFVRGVVSAQVNSSALLLEWFQLKKNSGEQD